jgi:CheY-like chemotaxis protein
MLRLSLTDNGSGIDPSILPKIFEPFFTTKNKEEGTGLGLAIVHGIVARNKGFISVESELDQGTSFHVYLPIFLDDKENNIVNNEHLNDKLMIKRKVKAFFVDDDFSITRMAKVVLPKYGIEVECENDSSRAKALLEKNVNDFDVLITDQVMPSVSGIDLARHALELHPSLPVIICTGYSDSISSDDLNAVGVRTCLLKPPDYHQMARLIHSWIK